MKKYIIPSIFIVAIILINLVSFFLLDGVSVVAIIASIAGVISCVMAAQGHISCYYFGIINILFYLMVTYDSKFYGAMAQAVVFSLPMQFYGLYSWRKNLNKDTNLVKTRRLSLKTLIISLIVSVILALIYSLVLSLFNSASPILESIITFFNLIAMYLYVKRYNEQWIYWILINSINVWMWVNATINNDSNGIIMSATWTLYLVNSIYGYANWHKLIESEK